MSMKLLNEIDELKDALIGRDIENDRLTGQLKELRQQMLEFAAKACGIDGVWQDEFGMHLMGKYLLCPGELPRYWNPLTNSADCAAMCAKLAINTRFWIDGQYAKCFDQKYAETQRFEDHNNDREAAWRYAATMVAAKIGGMK